MKNDSGATSVGRGSHVADGGGIADVELQEPTVTDAWRGLQLACWEE
jgi:hypothetical protein